MTLWLRLSLGLWQFIMLASIIVIAFACAFYVLLMNERAVSLHDGTVDLTDDAAEVTKHDGTVDLSDVT